MAPDEVVGVLPASETKHLDTILHPSPANSTIIFSLKQLSSCPSTTSKTHASGPSLYDGIDYLRKHVQGSSSATQHGHDVGPGLSDAAGGRTGSTGTTGTTLWLGAQVLSCYLASTLPDEAPKYSPAGRKKPHAPSEPTPAPAPAPATATARAESVRSHTGSSDPPRSVRSRKTILELGSGTGYLSLVLAGKGYDVISTDIEPVLSSVLWPNVESGLRVLRDHLPLSSVGDIRVVELDWTKESGLEGSRSPLHEDEDEVQGVQSECDEDEDDDDDGSSKETKLEGMGWMAAGIDVIVMSDTIYHPPLNPSLFATIRRICQSPTQSRSTTVSTSTDLGSEERDGTRSRSQGPVIYLALERRDSTVIDSALDLARDMGFKFKRVGQGRVVKSIRGTGWGWDEQSWEGVEIWKGRWGG